MWDFRYAVHPNHYRLKGRSDTTQLILQTISNVLFFGGYGLIIFSSGLDVYKILINILIVAALHIIIFPFISKRIYIPKK
jgi:hypothetical protein